MKPTTSEASIQKGVAAYLRLIGAVVIRVNGGGAKMGDRFVRFTDTVGCPDLLFCLAGRFCACECKKKGGRLRPEQAAVIDAINRAGGVAFVATSIDDAERALRAEGLIR